MNEEAFPEAAAILRDAGWKPHDQWGVYTRGSLVMGLSPDGQHFDVKNTAIAPDGPDTPDDPVEAALWLVRLRAPAVVVDDVVTYEPPAEAQSLFGEPAEAAYGGEDETHGETGEAAADLHDYARADSVPEDAGQSGDVAAGGESEDWHAGMGEGSAGHGGAAGVPEQDWGGGGDGDLPEAPIDADFAPIEDEPPERDALDADLTPLRGIAWDENTLADEEAAASTEGPIAYAASDLDALVREKLGRVSQIARELKAALQDGWTIDEFRSLQNLIVRIDRGEATDDAQARARFVAISERSQAMSRVDAHRDALEAALDAIGKARDYQGAKDFNPEVGWP